MVELVDFGGGWVVVGIGRRSVLLGAGLDSESTVRECCIVWLCGKCGGKGEFGCLWGRCECSKGDVTGRPGESVWFWRLCWKQMGQEPLGALEINCKVHRILSGIPSVILSSVGWDKRLSQYTTRRQLSRKL